MKFKRFLSVMLSLTMLFSVAACGSQTEDSVQSGTETKTEAETKTEVEPTSEVAEEISYDPFGAYDETVKIEIGRVQEDRGIEFPDGMDYVNNPVNDYIKEKLNIEIDYTWEGLAAGENYNRTVSLAIAAQEIPDILWINDRTVLNQLVENDLVADLTEVYENYASDEVKALYESCSGDILGDYASADGKIVALPHSPNLGLAHLIWVRQDWVDTLGLTLDEDGNDLITREEIEMVAKAFIDNDPGKSGNPVGLAIFPNLNMDANTAFTSFNYPFGGFYRLWFDNGDGTVRSGSVAPETKEILGWWNDMFTKGILDPQYGITGWDQILEMLVANRLGIVSGEATAPTWMLLNTLKADPNAYFKAYAVDDGTGKTTWATWNEVSRWVVVSKDCENPEAAVKLLNVMTEMKDTNKFFAENPEFEALSESLGVLYKDLAPLYIDISAPSTVYEEFTACKNGEIAYEELEPDMQTLYDQLKKYEDDPASATPEELARYIRHMEGQRVVETLEAKGLVEYVSPIYGIVTETMTSKLADLNKLEEETYVKIITGEEPVDYFDTFVEEYNARGGAAICEELAGK